MESEKILQKISENDIKENLTPEQIEKWKTGDDELQEEVMDEVEFEFSHDKVIDDYDYPELIEDE